MLARRLNYMYLDTGAMYRAVALWRREGSTRKRAGPERSVHMDFLQETGEGNA
jgi:cytidylate kinase